MRITEEKMMNIVRIPDSRPFTTSLSIARGVKYPHKSVIELIREHLSYLERLGKVAFEVLLVETAGDSYSTEIAILNDPQATFIITCIDGNEVRIDLLMQLIQAFHERRQARAVALVDLSDPLVVARAIHHVSIELTRMLAEKVELEHKFEQLQDENMELEDKLEQLQAEKVEQAPTFH